MYFERYAMTKDLRKWSNLRIIAAKRAVQREAEAMALCPELRRYSTVEERQEQMDRRSARITATLRTGQAESWRKVRHDFRELPPEVRARVLARWETRYMPGNPAAFASTILMEAGSPWAESLRRKWIDDLIRKYQQEDQDRK